MTPHARKKTKPEEVDPSTLPDKYSGKRLTTLFIKGMDNTCTAIRNVPIKMTVGDFIKYAAHQMGVRAIETRLLFGQKPLVHGMSIFSSIVWY